MSEPRLRIDKGVQARMIRGHIDSNDESRWFSMLATDLNRAAGNGCLDRNHVCFGPEGFLYNPNGAPVTVVQQSPCSGAQPLSGFICSGKNIFFAGACA
jgi:hypothetical protein